MKKETENKELFTAGDWIAGIPTQNRITGMWECLVITNSCFLGERVAKGIGETKEIAFANASLIAESKNMYQHIKWIVEYLKNANSVYIEKNSHMHRDFEEILNRINNQKI